MNKFEHVFSDDHQMPLEGMGLVLGLEVLPCLMSGGRNGGGGWYHVPLRNETWYYPLPLRNETWYYPLPNRNETWYYPSEMTHGTTPYPTEMRHGTTPQK